jgi:Flp pilus assembly protein TadG
MFRFLGSTAKRAWRARNGVAAIEFALAAPVFLVLLTGLVELGFGLYQAMEVQDAAEAGALYAAKHGWDPAGISDAVVSATGVAGVTASPAPSTFCGCPDAAGIATTLCTATCVGGAPPGQYVQVNAAVPHQTILPYPALPLPATMTGRATVRLN